jgi:hypothetical protein
MPRYTYFPEYLTPDERARAEALCEATEGPGCQPDRRSKEQDQAQSDRENERLDGGRMRRGRAERTRPQRAEQDSSTRAKRGCARQKPLKRGEQVRARQEEDQRRAGRERSRQKAERREEKATRPERSAEAFLQLTMWLEAARRHVKEVDVGKLLAEQPPSMPVPKPWWEK